MAKTYMQPGVNLQVVRKQFCLGMFSLYVSFLKLIEVFFEIETFEINLFC